MTKGQIFLSKMFRLNDKIKNIKNTKSELIVFVVMLKTLGQKFLYL